MPKKYERMRDSFKSQGLSDKAAKGKAARIYNAQRPEGAAPVTRAHNPGGRASGGANTPAPKPRPPGSRLQDHIRKQRQQRRRSAQRSY